MLLPHVVRLFRHNHQRPRSSNKLLTLAWISLVGIIANAWLHQQDRTGAIMLKLEERATENSIANTQRREKSLWNIQLRPKPKKWKNRHDIVHVVSTRFMQTQPHLTVLGRARLELLKSVTVPSLMHQSTSEFLWMIRTDPDLDAGLLDDLKREVNQVPNAVLILSNVGRNDIRRNVSDVTPQTVVAGSYDLVMSYHLAAQSKVVLETQLDADDAVSLTFIEYLQDAAAERTNLPQSRPNSWLVFCFFDSIEWQVFNPWDVESKEGVIVPATSSWCITAGLTKAYCPGAKFNDFPTHNHVKLWKKIGRCSESDQVNCVIKMQRSPNTVTFRSRTPTSDGMKDLYTADSDAPQARSVSQQGILRDHQKYWNDLKDRFGIVGDHLVRARTMLLDNVSAVVSDAQSTVTNCTNIQMNCKQSKKEKLENFLAKIEPTETTKDEAGKNFLKIGKKKKKLPAKKGKKKEKKKKKKETKKKKATGL